MKILFIDPMGDTEENVCLNIGIAYCVAAVIEKGHTASVLDLASIREGNPDIRIKNAVANFKPDIVGISVTNMSFNNTRTYAKSIRSYFEGPLVLGGPEITALKEKSLHNMPEADMAIIGEGEIVLPELLSSMENGLDLKSINGLVWRKGNNIIANPRRESIDNLDSAPFPNYEVFGVDKMDLYPITTSRGCPHGCIFCFSSLGKKWRARSPHNIIEEIKIAKNKYGAKLFDICDASFNLDIERVMKFCNLLIKEEIEIPWIVNGIRADKVTEEMVCALKKANCKRVYVGIETLESSVFKNINKGETIRQIKRGIKLIKQYGIEVYGFMVIGLPGDTFEKALSSLAKAQKLNLDKLIYSSSVPFTGTALEKWANKSAVILHENSYNISQFISHTNNVAYETEDFTEEERREVGRIVSGKTSGRNIEFKYGIYFNRLPDGTWGKSKNGSPPHFLDKKKYFVNFNRRGVCEEVAA